MNLCTCKYNYVYKYRFPKRVFARRVLTSLVDTWAFLTDFLWTPRVPNGHKVSKIPKVRNQN